MNPSRITFFAVTAVLALIFCFTVESAEAGIITPPLAQDDNLVLRLGFDEGNGTIAYDSSGNGNNGTIYGATWVQGRYGYGLSFDGVDDYAVTNNTITFDVVNNSYTFTAWIKIEYLADHTNYVIACKYPRIGIAARDRNGLQYKVSGWLDGFFEGKGYLDYGKWYFVAVVYHANSSQRDVYVNGEYVGTDASGSPSSFTWEIYIGYDPSHRGYSTATKGIIDEVRIYNRALSEEEIKSIYEAFRLHIRDETNQQAISSANVTIFNSNTSIAVPIDDITNDAVLFHANMSSYGQYLVSVSAPNYYTRKLITNIQNNTLTEMSAYLPSTSESIIYETFTLSDVTGKYSPEEIILSIKKPFQSGTEPVYQSYFDSSGKTTTYLILDSNYIIDLITPDGTISKGWIYPDPSGTISIQLSEISLSPVYSALQRDINYEFRQENNTIKLIYNDTSSTTTSITFTVINSSGTVIYTSSTEASNAEFTFNTSGLNESFVKAEFVAHTKYGEIKASKYFFLSQPLDVGLSTILNFGMKNLLFGGFIIVLAFTFGYRDSYKGAILISLLAVMLSYAGLLDVPWNVASIALSYAILAYLAKSAKEWEGLG